jgi:D-methionine transport system permease protein
VGGGGIGDLAITYGYQRFSTITIVATVIILVVLVQGIQSLGNRLARKIRRK